MGLLFSVEMCALRAECACVAISLTYTGAMKMKPTTRLTLISFLLFMSSGMSGPISSVTWRSLGASYLVIGLLGTVRSLTSIVANPLWGKASDRLGQRRIFLVGGVGVSRHAIAGQGADDPPPGVEITAAQMGQPLGPAGLLSLLRVETSEESCGY